MTAGTRTRPVMATVPLLRAAHIGPALAVTCVVALLATATDLPVTQGILVTTAVLAGQLTIGWGNDLLDAGRDLEVGRTDKPLATGELSRSLVVRCLAVAGTACVLLSLLTGWRSGLVHLGLGVGFGHLYNLGFKATPWSWLPYAVAFGTLPAVVTLAGAPPVWPPAWTMLTAAALGVGAHFLNTLPDFDADESTGIQGLPHRLGEAPSRVVATTLLVAASVTAALGPAEPPSLAVGVALVVVGLLAVLALVGRGKVPFYAAIAIALVDVGLLTVVAS